MRNQRRVDRLHDRHPNLVPVDAREQRAPRAEEHRCQRNIKLINQPCVEVLQNRVGPAGFFRVRPRAVDRVTCDLRQRPFGESLAPFPGCFLR